MKLAVLFLVVALSGCTQHNEFGSCIGVLNDENPSLRYEFHIGNAIGAVIFSETIVVPAIWFFSYAKCPYARNVP